MILRELFYIDPNTRDMGNELRYSPQRDDTMLHTDDTRKTRLTLKQINELLVIKKQSSKKGMYNQVKIAREILKIMQ